MNKTFYFSHDYNARNDDKLLELRALYGNEGYAVYFYCLETMAERGDGYIKATLIGGLSLGYNVSKEYLEKFLEKCTKLELFCKDKKGYFNKRMIGHLEFRRKLSEAGRKGGLKGGLREGQTKERKGKEIYYNNKKLLNDPTTGLTSEQAIKKMYG